MTGIRPKSCDRARLWVSLAVDDELSEFERRLLGVHVERCADCRAYEASVRTTTALLRAEPRAASERQIAIPRQRPTVGVMRLAASAAAAALVAVGITGFFATSGQQQRPAFLDQVSQTKDAEAADLRALRRSEIASQRQPVPPEHIQGTRAD
jgi:Putative zinc-finger